MNLSCQKTSNRSLIRCISGLGFVALALVIINVVMSARVAQDGLLIDDLAQKEAALKTDIAQLEQKLITDTSLADLSVKALELGYQSPQANLTVTSTLPVAYNLNHE